MRCASITAALAAALLCACPEEPDDEPADAATDAPDCDLAVSLGTGGQADRFAPYGDGDVAEVIRAVVGSRRLASSLYALDQETSSVAALDHRCYLSSTQR